MKMEITIRTKNDDGTETVKPVVIDVSVPDFDAFDSPERFLEVFHEYEQAVLKARNLAAEQATEEYLRELSKKKQIKPPPTTRSK